MNVREIPVVFDCQGSELIGMVHVPQAVHARGLLVLVAGGPQYRAGVGRQQVYLARQLAAQGIPVMRFDYRGLGDSDGEFRNFEDVEADLAAALRTFRQQVPAMKEVVLWGGCNAASAIMINAWKYPEVTGMVLSNPWVHTRETGDAVTVKHHYSRRIREKDFWLKVLRLQYNPFPAAWTVLRSLATRWLVPRGAGGVQTAHAATVAQDDPSQPFIPRMCNGMQRFKGDLLLLMSGRSILSKEFDDLVANDLPWQRAMHSPRHSVRHDMPDADQTQSSLASRLELVRVAGAWMLDRQAPLAAPVTTAAPSLASAVAAD